MPARSSIYSGDRFGALVALHRLREKAPDRGAIWAFACDCGKTTSIRARHVVRGDVKSCGCKRLSALGKSTEGKGSVYITYRCMLARCFNKKHERYPDYGGRGISVYYEWLGPDGFKNFYAYVGNRPRKKTLDRIDGTKDYEPGNVRWATKKEQAQNRRAHG